MGLTGGTDSFSYNLEGPTKVKPLMKIMYPCDINATAQYSSTLNYFMIIVQY